MPERSFALRSERVVTPEGERPAVVAKPTAAARGLHVDVASRDGMVPGSESDIGALHGAGVRVHLLYLSAAGALEILDVARREGLPITVETCPHYLTLAAEDIADGATDHTCAPPVRDLGNQQRRWAALAEGTTDAVVSDHPPSSAEDEHVGDGDIMAAWGGIFSLQRGPALASTAARSRGFGLIDLVRWMASGPAQEAGLRTRGRIAAGVRPRRLRRPRQDHGRVGVAPSPDRRGRHLHPAVRRPGHGQRRGRGHDALPRQRAGRLLAGVRNGHGG